MRLPGLVGVAVAAVLTAGCLVEVEKVSDPSAVFARARAEADRAHGRPGAPGTLHVLAWDRADGELVRVSLPMWMVRKIDEHSEIDLGDETAAAANVKAHLRLKDLDTAGRGVLVEVEEEDGDQVLVWLS
jgi:hypothetical protein